MSYQDYQEALSHLQYNESLSTEQAISLDNGVSLFDLHNFKDRMDVEATSSLRAETKKYLVAMSQVAFSDTYLPDIDEILNDDDRLNIGYEKLQNYLEDVTKAMLIALLDGNAKRTTNLNSNTLTEKREIFYNALKREQYKDTTNKPWSNWRDTHSSVNISTVSKTNNVVTVTTSAAHGLDMSYDDWGAVIVINNSDFDIVSANYPNGVPIILTGADTFTYAKSGPDVAITSVSGTGDIKIGWGGDSNNLHLYFT